MVAVEDEVRPLELVHADRRKFAVREDATKLVDPVSPHAARGPKAPVEITPATDAADDTLDGDCPNPEPPLAAGALAQAAIAVLLSSAASSPELRKRRQAATATTGATRDRSACAYTGSCPRTAPSRATSLRSPSI
jgi:hypothetical protein